jgi:aryl-alcohol dehydrogenase-like predicted oxidoreductase
MASDEQHGTDRRRFLQTGALATAAALGAGGSAPAQDAKEEKPALPRRKLGKSGVEVTILEQGAILGSQTDRVIRLSYAQGVRVFDTAHIYRTEPNFRKWFEAAPEVRKEIFLVTKDIPRQPSDLLRQVDERLKALGTDYLDLFFIHGLGDPPGSPKRVEDAIKLVKSAEFGKVADTIRKAGKARLIGFSTHHKDRAAIIQAAAEGGIVDAIMLQYTPWLDKDSPLNKALDAAHAKGIGLISMKQIAGHQFGDKPKGNILDDVARRVPTLKDRNLTPFQGLLHAIWTDERISTVCVSMRNTDQIRQNIDAAARYEPLKEADIRQLRDAVLAQGPTLCADCDGRCAVAAGTTAALGDLTRFLTYHEHHGDRAEARRQYADLPPEARDWQGADLEAARAACPNRLDFARLMPEVDRQLA